MESKHTAPKEKPTAQEEDKNNKAPVTPPEYEDTKDNLDDDESALDEEDYFEK